MVSILNGYWSTIRATKARDILYLQDQRQQNQKGRSYNWVTILLLRHSNEDPTCSLIDPTVSFVLQFDKRRAHEHAKH